MHRSAIVNLDHVDEVARTFNGACVVEKKDRRLTELPISRHSNLKRGLT